MPRILTPLAAALASDAAPTLRAMAGEMSAEPVPACVGSGMVAGDGVPPADEQAIAALLA